MTVLSWRRPEAAGLAAAVEAGGPLSYAEVGATEGPLPAGYHHDAQQISLGRGAETFARARAAIRAWKPFDLPWVHLHRPDAPIAVGEVVAFSSRQLGLWAANVCRIVEVVDDDRRYGFAYGTLAGHVVAGEERFLVAWDPHTDEVTFEIRKFSRAAHPLVTLAGPVARWVQRRFTRDALAAVARAVRG
jgi:uncharacterized protein (UPF0548 family)